MSFTNAFSSSLRLDMEKYRNIFQGDETPFKADLGEFDKKKIPTKFRNHSYSRQYQPIWSLGFPIPPMGFWS